MNTNFTNFFNYAAKEPQNTGGGNSRHEALIIAEQFSQRYALRSEGAQQRVSESETRGVNHALITQLSRNNHTITLRAIRYVAVLLMVFMVGIGNAWGTATNLSESIFIQTYSAKVGDNDPTLSDLTTDFPSYLATYNSPATANGSGCSSSVTSPHNFSTNVASATKYWRIKCGNGKGLQISSLSNVKTIHVYGNGSSSTRTVTAAVSGGTLASGANKQQSFANSNTTIVDYTFDISSLTNYSASDAYTITITPNGDIHIWGIYLEANSGGDTPSTYSVTYNGNGKTDGDVPTDSNSPYAKDATVTVLGNTGNLEKTNYTFTGWNTAADGSGTHYDAGATFSMGTSNVTLYAEWELSLTTHTPGKYTTAQASSGYGADLITYNSRKYEVYYVTYTSSKLYICAGNLAYNATGHYNLIDGVTTSADAMYLASDSWFGIAANSYGNSGSINIKQFNVNASRHAATLVGSNYVKLKVSGYDNFAFIGRDGSSSGDNTLVVKIDGESQTEFEHTTTDPTVYSFDITTGEHVIEVTTAGGGSNRFRGFSLRLPAPSCPAPKSLTNGTTTYNSQAVTWTKGDDESAWEVIHLAKDATAPAANATPDATVTSASYTFTGLTESTAYDWYVRAKCGDSDKSDWVKGTSFTTEDIPACAATAPGSISAGALTDGEITLTAEGSEEDGDTWYWQSSATGEDKTGTSGASITVDEAGTYYIRSYNTAGNCWSDAESYELTDEDFLAHYAITYNKGAYGTGSISAGDKTEDVTFTLSSQMFTRDGYVQVGWATTDGGTKAYDLGGSYTANAAITLYPVWAPKETYVAAFEYDSENPAAPARWEFSTGDHTSTSNSADYVPTFGSEYPGDGPSDDNYIAFAKGGSAYAIYDLEYSTTVSQITATLYGGSSSDVSIDIQYLGADKSTVKNTYTAKAKNWGSSHTDAVSNDVVANVRYIKVKGASKWVVLSAFSVTYGDVTPKYTVTYVPNNGVEPAETMTDSDSPYKAGTEVTLLTNTFTAPSTKEFDAWVVTPAAGGDPITITNGKFTMPSANVNVTATWKTPAPKYGVTYALNGPTGDAPTEASKAEGAEFTLAAAPSWDGHVFQGWKWTDATPEDHVVSAEAAFTMPAYAVTFTAQWKLDPNASMADAKYVIGGSALNMAAKYESSNTDSPVLFSLKEDSEDASITSAGLFTATVAGEYVVVAEQAGNATYAKGEAEATVEVLESELEDTYVWKKSAYTGSCVASPNEDAPAAQYTSVTVDGMASVASGRPETAGDVTITLAISSAYSSLFGIKSVCAFGKIEETAGIEYSWNNTDWTPMAGGESSDSKHEFTAPAGSFPTSLYIRFTNVETGKKGVWFRNALVTLEAKKAIVSTVIDLTDVKINGTSISSDDLATLKTADAYALNLADEYVTAPTVKFTKHTVITYDDESVVAKDDIITETADVNGSGKWEASAEIGAITYTVTMAKADAFIVHYYQADGETLIGSENVAVNGHPTAVGITPTPQDYKRVVWTLSDEPVDLEDVTSAVAGTEITLEASYVTAYASSINIEQWVLDNSKNNTAFRAALDEQYYKYADLNELDSLRADKNESDRNYPFLGQKIKTEGGYISFLLKAGSELHVKFGNIPAAVNLIVNDGEPVAKSASFDYTAGGSDEIIKLATTTDGTVVFKQIMINEAIETVVLPAIVTYDANGGSFAKTSEKYTGTPLVIAAATPADEDYEFEGWHVGTVDGTKIDASAYAPTKNVTLVAKYVAKPSPFSLSTLTYKIGSGDATAVGYVEGTYEYDVELPYAPSYDAITVAYTLMDGTSSEKSGAVLSVTSVPGAATFTIVAANTTEKTYTVNFTKDAKDGLEIIGAAVTGNTTATVTGLYKGTASVKLSDKKIDKGDYYIYVTLKEGQTLQNGDVLVVDVNAKSDIGTKALEICTGTGNLDNGILTSVAVDDYSTGENSIVLASVPAGATSIGLKRSDNLNAKINGLKVYRPMNPVLKSITFDGTKIDVTGLTAGETLPYSANLTSVTPEIFWNGAGTAVVTTNAGAWAWGDNTYVLTDKDGDATTYTITLTRATRSSDKSLSSLTVDGHAIALEEGVYNYTYVYPYGTDPATVPAVAAVANDAHASVGTITQAASTAGTASFTVTAENETTQDYTVRFAISRIRTLVIYDGNSLAASGSLEPGLEWTTKDGTTSESSASALTFEGKSYTKYVNIFSSATKAPGDGDTRYMTITIPENYMAKFRLIGCSNSSSYRSLFISKEITSTVDESIAYVTTTSSVLAGMTSDYQFPGTYYLCCDNSIRLYELSVTLYPIDYSREVTQGRYGTICLPNGGVMVGATIFKVAHMTYQNDKPYKVFFDEVINGVMEAGMPYIFMPKENATVMGVYYTDNVGVTAGNELDYNGLHGTLDYMDGEALYGKYIFSNNSIFMSENPNNWLNANRAYIVLSEVPDYITPVAPGCRRVSMGVNGTNTATGFENIEALDDRVQKVLIDGKIYILRGEKMFDTTGRLVK